MKLVGFSKEERIRRAEEFTRILHEGARVQGRFIRAFWILDDQRESQKFNRVGVAAGKRLGKAAARNLLKRRIREAYRRNKKELPCQGVAIIFVASSRMIGRGAGEVEEDVADLLRHIAISLGSASHRSERSSSSTGS